MKQETLVLALVCLVIGFWLGHYLTGPHFELHDGVILNTYTGGVSSPAEEWNKEYPDHDSPDTNAAQKFWDQNMGTNK